MARWDLAEWVGPTPNRTVGGMSEYRGLVIHIMQGSYDGSIAWGKNPTSGISFHFATRRDDGHCGQLVDTADGAWTQAAGNGHWLSVENEGFSGDPLTAGQLEACAQIYARGVRDHGWPYQLADSPSGVGLGWHGMGGAAWGGHFDCPGEPIKAQRGAILTRAQQINSGGTAPPGQGDIDMRIMQVKGGGRAFLVDGIDYGVSPARPKCTEITGSQVGTYQFIGIPYKEVDFVPWDEFTLVTVPVAPPSGGGSVTGPVDLTPAAVEAVADAVVDEQHDRLAQ